MLKQKDMRRLVAAGKLKPVAHGLPPTREARTAQENLESDEQFGNTVLARDWTWRIVLTGTGYNQPASGEACEPMNPED